MKESDEIDKDSVDYFLKRATCKSLDLATQIKNAARHHIDSFNFIYEEGLEKVCLHLPPLEIVQNPVVTDENNNTTTKNLLLPFKKMKIWFEVITMGYKFL